MTGVCSGNVRSTPTPKLTLRTVKVSRIPPPWRRMTTPWKTWMRERLPSTTRTCTLTVSPGRNSGMSLRSESASRASRVFIAAVLSPSRARLRSGQRWAPAVRSGELRSGSGAAVGTRRPLAAALYCATTSGDDARRPRPGPLEQLRERRRQFPRGELLAAPGDVREAPPPVRLLREQLQLGELAGGDVVDDVAQREVGLAVVDVHPGERPDEAAQPDRALERGGVHDQADLLG